jgi:hypothetical protein
MTSAPLGNRLVVEENVRVCGEPTVIDAVDPIRGPERPSWPDLTTRLAHPISPSAKLSNALPSRKRG